jgi:hypothetical protein
LPLYVLDVILSEAKDLSISRLLLPLFACMTDPAIGGSLPNFS